METSQGRLEDEKRDRAAVGRSCQKWPAVGVAVALAALLLVNALVLSSVLSAAQGPKLKDTFGEDLLEQLQQFQLENQDLKLMLQSLINDSRCHLCPSGWRWWRSHCYFFSVAQEEDLQWNESAEFCQQHNSSLAVIKDSAEMVTFAFPSKPGAGMGRKDFLQRVMSEFPCIPFLWVGLTDIQKEGQWLWWDGTEVQHYLQSVEWDTEDRDCADLRGGGSLFAAQCDVYGPWVCKKQS